LEAAKNASNISTATADRMADYMIEEFQRWQAGEPLQHKVTMAILDTMA
tara:strand:- start:63 stop:209 length:147 start_codon:yes stop_codon:yes gene_type:complete